MLNLKPVGSNQTEVRGNDTVVFFSYQTPVATVVDGRRYRTETRWSRTTERHINKWLRGLQVEVVPQSFFDGLLTR